MTVHRISFLLDGKILVMPLFSVSEPLSVMVCFESFFYAAATLLSLLLVDFPVWIFVENVPICSCLGRRLLRCSRLRSHNTARYFTILSISRVESVQ